jgi:hypothetical protein
MRNIRLLRDKEGDALVLKIASNAAVAGSEQAATHQAANDPRPARTGARSQRERRVGGSAGCTRSHPPPDRPASQNTSQPETLALRGATCSLIANIRRPAKLIAESLKTDSGASCRNYSSLASRCLTRPA